MDLLRRLSEYSKYLSKDRSKERYIMDKIDNDFINKLEKRFKAHMERHPKVEWDTIKEKILNDENLYNALYSMEETGGEPDLVSLDIFKSLVYVDLSEKSPTGRTSLCYDKQSRIKRKKNPPQSSVEEEIKAMGVRLLDEDQYYALAEIASFDSKSTSWIKTPSHIIKEGGALFASQRFGRAFTYFNGSESYYRNRGFRAYIEI